MEALEIQKQIQEKWMIFWIALGIGLVAFILAWHKGLFKPFRATNQPVIKGTNVLTGFGYFLFMEILFIPSLLSIIFFLSGWQLTDITHFMNSFKGWINLFLLLGGFLGVVFAYFSLTPIQRRELWKQTPVPWYEHLGIGIATWFVSYPWFFAFSQAISLTVWYLFHHSSIEQVVVQNLRSTLSNPWLFSLTALTVVTLVPLMEEFLFRGLLQSWFKRTFHHTSLAIILSSLIFSLFHYSYAQGLSNIELLSSLFMLSCVLGFLYERQHSLWAPIGLHAFFNFISLWFIFKE